METVPFTKKSLATFIHSQRYYRLANVPISKQRAVSQINNPRADDDDLLLVVQLDDDKTVGYLGVLPDYLFFNSGYEKVGWLTCFWVDEKYKSQNVAANLFLRAIRAWDKKILITNIVPSLEPVYQKTNIFQPTKYKIGYRGYLRFNLAEILPPKNCTLSKLTPLLKLSDWFLNIFVDLRLVFIKEHPPKDVKFEYLSSFDEIPADFLSKFSSYSWNQRSMAELNWIVKNPWLMVGAIPGHSSSRYYFSSLSRQFFYQIIKFTDDSGNIIATVLITVRNRRMAVPYIFCDEKNMAPVLKFIVNTMVKLKLNMVTVYNETLADSFRKSKTPFITSKKIRKPYLISKAFNFIDSLNFQDGDGDCAFY
ncbi:MAG: hypothetical protein AB7S54_09880 [Bacteroidales bacterium]